MDRMVKEAIGMLAFRGHGRCLVIKLELYTTLVTTNLTYCLYVQVIFDEISGLLGVEV